MVNFNNINLTHNGVRISIAQHKDEDTNEVHIQEVGVLQGMSFVMGADWDCTVYEDTLEDLIQTLTAIKTQIDENQTKGEN
jgi:hypothetical protein